MMLILKYVGQFFVSMIPTMAFAVIFNAPKKELVYCGISGGLGWLFYVLVVNLGGGPTLGNVVGALVLTIFSRILAIIRKNPATVYLIAGIFPLVPGAGIYYTAYYLITDNMPMFSDFGLLTLKTAGAIVMGIIFGMAPSQNWLNKVFGAFDHKSANH